jgi:hypothetical protein
MYTEGNTRSAQSFALRVKQSVGRKNVLKLIQNNACSSYLWVWRYVFKKDVVS